MKLSADDQFELNLITQICNNLYDKSEFGVYFWSSETGPLLNRLNQLNGKRGYGYTTTYGEGGLRSS